MGRELDPQAVGDHLDRLYRAAWALCGSREDAEDLVQETYARVLSRSRLLRERATGARTDILAGRRMTTVFYAKGARRIAYTIVGGAALGEPAGRDRVVEGTRVRLVRARPPALVTWQRRGHTCVLSGTADPETLRKLAAWRGMGAVAF